MENQTLNIVTLIEKNPITRFKESYNNRFIQKVKEHFSNAEQQLFLSSFYCYLNYDTANDFVICLNDMWKWLGFSRIDHCKTVLIKHFVKDVDYKIILCNLNENAAPEVAEAGNCERKKGGAGLNKEKILMNIKTFKKLCLKAGTKKADEIHDYYIKLEEILQEVSLEESKELQDQLQEKIEKIQMLENKPETEGFYPKTGYIYLIKDTASLGAYKIGLGEKPDRRLITLNIASSQKSLKMTKMFKSENMRYAEKMIHVLLEPFRIKRRNEWFFLGNNMELNYAIHMIQNCIDYTDNYNFVDYNSFKNYAEAIGDNLEKINEENIIFETPKKYVNNNFISRSDKLSKYHGVSWCLQQNKWMSRLTKDNDTIFLGVYESELEAAIAYNDYAMHVNENSVDINYRLNDIENYIPNPRNIPEEQHKKKMETKTSVFNGVYFIKSKQIFEASIQYKKKDTS